MRFAVLAQNETMESLAARVYDLADASPAALRDAGKVLTEANPFLRRIDEVPPGTLVLVPPIPGVKPGAQTQAPGTLPAAAVAAQLRGAIALVRQRLASEVEAELADATETVGLSKSREARAAAREAPEIGSALPQLGEAAAARAAAARELQQYQAHAFARMEFDLEDLMAEFGSDPSRPPERA